MPKITHLIDRIFQHYRRRNARAENEKDTGYIHPYPKNLSSAPLDRLEYWIMKSAERFLARFRVCAICHRGDEQEYFIVLCDHLGDFDVHVDCGAEYNDACSIDETTQYLGESDKAWRIRMPTDIVHYEARDYAVIPCRQCGRIYEERLEVANAASMFSNTAEMVWVCPCFTLNSMELQS